MNQIHEAALHYFHLGLPITLCRGKQPIGKDWPNYVWNPDRIDREFQAYEDLNVGIRLGPTAGLIDVETDAPEAEDLLTELFGGDVPVTPTFTSPRGTHRFFDWHDELESIGKASFKIGDLEFRIGANRKAAQSLMPPSITDGVRRKWLLPIDECNPAQLPEHIRQKLLEHNGILGQPVDVSQRAQSKQRVQSGTEDIGSVLSVFSDVSVPSGNSVLSVTGADALSVVSGLSVTDAVNVAIKATAPRSPGKRHRAVFEFARQLKAIPALAKAGFATLRPYVLQWHEFALPYIATKPFEDTWADFIEGWGKVKFVAGEEPIVKNYNEAILQPLPQCAANYSQTDVRNLVALCRALQRMAGAAPFYLAGRTAAKLLGVEHKRAARWFHMLLADSILTIVKQGVRNRATRYWYVGGD